MDNEKQLNFSAPLLSVRKHSSSPDRRHFLQVQGSGWDSEMVSESAAIPFLWERIPGKPKSSCATRSFEEPLITPKLPPGRLPGVSQKSGVVSKVQTINNHPNESLAFNGHAAILASLNEKRYMDGKSDGRDTLSETELLSLNRRLSSFSGLTSGNFSIDPKTRDLMMSRFLPAVEAAVLETLQHVPRKQYAVTEQPKPVKRIASAEREPLLNHEYIEDAKIGDAEEESDDPGKRKCKTCAILPCTRIKNSESPFHPVPQMRFGRQRLPPKRQTRNACREALGKKAYGNIDKKGHDSGVATQEMQKVENILVTKHILTNKSENRDLNLNLDQRELCRFTKHNRGRILDMKNEHDNRRPDEQRDSTSAGVVLTLLHPLPKTPSESWLSHTLPPICSCNPFGPSQGSNFHSKKDHD